MNWKIHVWFRIGGLSFLEYSIDLTTTRKILPVFEYFIQVLHGCRQFVLWSVWFSPYNERNPYLLLLKYFCKSIKNLGESLITNKLKVGVTPSRHGPYRLGYTRVTIIITMRSNNVSWSKTLKVILVQIILCNSRIWSWNRK